MRGSKVKSIYHVAAQSGILETWVAAVEVIGLVNILKSDDYFTVFAPSDDAFRNMPRMAVNDLLSSSESLVSNIGNHIVPGKILTREIAELTSLRSLMKNELFIEKGREMFVSRARIILPNIECRNGVIHVIDSVITIKKHRKVQVGGKRHIAIGQERKI